MKKGIFLLFMLAAGFVSVHAQKITQDGKVLAEIKGGGEVYVAGKVVGVYDSNGDVYKKGELIGVVKPNGELWIGGRKSGKVEIDGTVMKGSTKIGKVEPSGNVWDTEKVIANARGIKKEWVAGAIFFYFKEDIFPQ